MSSFIRGKSVLDVEGVFKFIEINKISDIDKAIRDDCQYFRRPNPTLDIFQRMVNRLIEKHGYHFPTSGYAKGRDSSSSLKDLDSKLDGLLEMKRSIELVIRGVSKIQEQVGRHEQALFTLSPSDERKSKVGSSFEFNFERMISNQALMLNRIKKIEDCLHTSKSKKISSRDSISEHQTTSPQKKVEIPDVASLTDSEILEKKHQNVPVVSIPPVENPLKPAPRIQKPSILSKFEKRSRSKKEKLIGSDSFESLHSSSVEKKSTSSAGQDQEYENLRNRKGSYSDPVKKKKRKKKTYTFRTGRRRPKTAGQIGTRENNYGEKIPSTSSSKVKSRKSLSENDLKKSSKQNNRRKGRKSRFENLHFDSLPNESPKWTRKRTGNDPTSTKKERKELGHEVITKEKEREKVKIEVKKENGISFTEPEEVGRMIPLSLIISDPVQSVLKREFCVKWNGKEVQSSKIFRKNTDSTNIDRFRFEVRIDRRGTNTVYVRYLDHEIISQTIIGCWTLDISKTKMRVLVKKKFPNSKNEKWRRSIPCLAERISHPNEGRALDLSQDQLDHMKRAEENITKFGEPGDIEKDGIKIWEKEEVYSVVTFRNEYDVVDLYDGVVITMKRLQSKNQKKKNMDNVTREIKLLNNSKTKRGNYIGYIPTDLPGEFEVSLVDKVRVIRIYPLQSQKKSPKKENRGSSRGGRFRSAPTSERRDPEKKIGSFSSSSSRRTKRNLPYHYYKETDGYSPQKHEKSSPKKKNNQQSSVPVAQYIPVKIQESAKKEIRIHICGNVGVVKDFPKKLKENLDTFGVNSVLLQEKVNRTRYLSYQMTWRRKMFDIHLRLNCDSYAPMMDEVGGEMKYLSKNSTTKTAIHVHFVPHVNFNDYTNRYRGKKIKEQDSSFHSGICLGTIYEDKDDFTFIHTSGALKIENKRSKEQSIKLKNYYNENMRGLCMLIRKIWFNLENIQRISNISLD